MTIKQILGGCGLAVLLLTHFIVEYGIHTQTQAEVLECIAAHGWSDEAIQICTKGSLYE